MIRDHEFLKCVQNIEPISVAFASGTTVIAHHREAYEIEVGGRINLTFKAYLKTSLKLDLVSCSRLDDYGYKTIFERGRNILKNRKDGVSLGSISRREDNGLYVAEIVPPKRVAKVKSTGTNLENLERRSRKKVRPFSAQLVGTFQHVSHLGDATMRKIWNEPNR